MASPKPSKRVPPDLARCQAEKSNGVNFMTLGGRFELVRCDRLPVVIATERKPGKDGHRGSMSLCHNCRIALLEKLGPRHCTFREIGSYTVTVRVEVHHVLRTPHHPSGEPGVDAVHEFKFDNIQTQASARTLASAVFQAGKKRGSKA